MHDDLDQEGVRIFVILRHPSVAPRRDVPPRGDPFEIGKKAAQLVVRMLGIRDEEQCRVAECAGLLIYAMDGYGLTYEEVCQVACHRVAEILKQITPDNRLTDPRRYNELKSMLGQADALTALVKLAEIAHTIECIPRVYTQAELAVRFLELKAWTDRAGKLLDSMAALRNLKPMQKTLRRVKEGLAGITDAATQAKDAEKKWQGGHTWDRRRAGVCLRGAVRDRFGDD